MEYVILLLAVIVAILIVPFVALSKAMGLEKKLGALEREIMRLRSQIELRERRAAQVAAAQPEVEVAEPEVPEEIAEPPCAEDAEEAEPSTWCGFSSVSAAEPDAPPTEELIGPPARSSREWEVLIGGNFFNRIGAVALLIGLAFLLEYAFDHNWITRWMLVGSGFAFGAALLVAGNYFFKSGARVFSQGLMGAGISILYLSVYASFGLYHLMPQTLALVLMCAVTVVAFTQALKSDALVVSVLGLIGGFLTPLILGGGAGGGSGFGFFTYVALLDAGLLAVSVRKDTWAVIEPLALAGSYLSYLAWYQDCYSPDRFTLTLIFLTVVWGLFYALDLYRSATSLTTFADLRAGVAVVNSLCYYAATYVILDARSPQWTGLFTLAIGAAYFAAMMVMRMRTDAVDAARRYAITAIALLAVATAVQFRDNHFVLVSLWSAEGLALVWCGIRWRMGYVWGCALGLLGVAAVVLVSDDRALFCHPVRAFTAIMNMRFLAFSSLAAALAWSAVLLGRLDDEIGRRAGTALHYAWCALLFLLFSVETNDYLRKAMAPRRGWVLADYYESMRMLAFGVVWACYSLPLALVGLRARVRPLVHSGYAVLTAGVVAIAVWGVDSLSLRQLSTGVSALVFAAAMIAVAVQQALLARHREEYTWADGVGGVLDAVLAALGFELLTTEIIRCFDKLRLHGAHTYLGIDIGLALLLTLAAVWAVYAVLVIWHGLRKKSIVLLVCGFGSLAAGIVTAAACGYQFAPIKSFALLANYRAAAFGVVVISLLAIQALLARRSAEHSWAVKALAVAEVITSLLIFELITVETLDFVRPCDPSGNLRQAALSVVWVVYSVILMSCGIWRRSPALRFTAIAIFELTILKVFIYDLASLETLYRIFSFMGLGLFLLATSYLYQRYKEFIFGSAG